MVKCKNSLHFYAQIQTFIRNFVVINNKILGIKIIKSQMLEVIIKRFIIKSPFEDMDKIGRIL